MDTLITTELRAYLKFMQQENSKFKYYRITKIDKNSGQYFSCVVSGFGFEEQDGVFLLSAISEDPDRGAKFTYKISAEDIEFVCYEVGDKYGQEKPFHPSGFIRYKNKDMLRIGYQNNFLANKAVSK